MKENRISSEMSGRPDERRTASTDPSNCSSLEHNTEKGISEPGNHVHRESIESPISGPVEGVSADSESTHEDETSVIKLPAERPLEYVTVTLKLTPAEFTILQEAHKVWKRENREEGKKEQMLSAMSRSYTDAFGYEQELS